jgi:hypothetical protein
MNTLMAFAMGEANRGRELMVFDWDQAARFIKEHNIQNAAAGLAGDWEYTGDDILRNGQPYTEGYTFLASTWATPQLYANGEFYDCYRMQSKTPNWDSDTTWPQSALDILAGREA